MRGLLALILPVLLSLGLVSPSFAVRVEPYGDMGWAENAAQVVRADGSVEELPRAAGVASGSGGASVPAAAPPDGGWRFNMRFPEAGTRGELPFYSFRASGGRVWIQADILPGDVCSVAVRSEDARTDVVYAPSLRVRDKVVFDAEENVRYSIRVSGADRDGYGCLSVGRASRSMAS